MSKRLGVGGLVFLLCLILISNQGQAIEYWTNQSSLVYGDTFYTDPYSPKIACNEEANKCILLVYDNNALATRGVKVLYSTNLFLTSTTITTITHDYSDELAYHPNYNMPYDVVYNNEYNKFFVISKSTLYSYIPSTNTWATNASVTSYDCDTNAGVQYPDFLGFLNETTALGFCLSWSASDIISIEYNVLSNTLTEWGSKNFPSSDPTTIEIMRGFQQQTAATNEIDVYAQSEDAENAEYDTISYPSDFLGLHHYTGSNLYYSRAENATGNISAGIWTAATSDLASFSSPVLKYALDTSIAETVNESDTFTTGQKLILTWSRYSNSTGNGIYLTYEDNKPVIIESHYDCAYTISSTGETDTGDIVLMYTSADEFNLTIDCDYVPLAWTGKIDLTGCDAGHIIADNLASPYDYSFLIRDSITNDGIATATIDLDTDSETTDANGYAEFSIQPVQNSYFKIEQAGCTFYLYTWGNPRTYSLEVSKAGYQTYNEYMTPAVPEFSGNVSTWDIETNRTILLDPSGVILYVHVYTADGVEIYPTSYNISVSGNNDLTYTFKDNYKILRTFTNLLPSKFLLFDNRSSYNITVTLETPTDTYTIDRAVTEDNSYLIEFFLNETLLDLPCTKASDCSPSFCDEYGYFHDLRGCGADYRCNYENDDCLVPDLCDAEIGCFSLGTDTPCSNRKHCSNETMCIDEYSMYIGLCGIDGYCKKVERQCMTGCNDTTGVCNELEDCLIGNYESIGYEIPGTGLSHTLNVVCELENAGYKYCENMGFIPNEQLAALGKTKNDVYFYPDGLSFIETEDGLKIMDVVVTCSESCDISYDFCESGECSKDKKSCLAPAASSAGMLAAVWAAWQYINGMIPVELRFLAWTVFTIAIMLIYRSELGKHGQNSDTSTLFVGILFFFAGIGIGYVHWVFLIIIGVVVSFLVYTKLFGG